jgi:hypothetical protein
MAIQFDNTNTGTATLRPATSGTIALTLPSADGTSGQALTTNGSGQLAFSTVGGGGGLTGFTAAESTAAPNATVYVDSLTASAASTDADVAFVAKGAGATLAQVPDSTTAGGNKRGTYATDWQKSRNASNQVASGNYSGILCGQNNRASGSFSAVVGGENNIASGSSSATFGGNSNTASSTNAAVIGGSNNTANASSAIVIGSDNGNASGIHSFIGGGSAQSAAGSFAAVIGGAFNTASGDSSSVLGGRRGTTRSIAGNFVASASATPIQSLAGVQQTALLVLGRQTTDATATRLASDTSAAATTNQVILPNNSAYFFQGQVVAGVTGAGDTKGWTVEGVIKRGANAASTVLVGTTVMSSYGDAGAVTWVVAVTADTTNGGLAITVTGQAATTIRWVAQIRTTEMTY